GVGCSGVGLESGAGEFVGMVGPSGTGRSTSLHPRGGLDRASAGIVEIDGQDLALLNPAALTRFRAERVGFVWQGAARNLVPYLTARQNVALPRAIGGAGGCGPAGGAAAARAHDPAREHRAGARPAPRPPRQFVARVAPGARA